jgi:hypothetical protein
MTKLKKEWGGFERRKGLADTSAIKSKKCGNSMCWHKAAEGRTTKKRN